MATFRQNVQTYVVVLWRNTSEGDQRRALIICNARQRENGIPVTFTIEFFEDGASLPPNESFADGSFGRLHTHAAHYAAFVDLLRNESPVSAVIDTDQPDRNRLSTSREPAGEGEL